MNFLKKLGKRLFLSDYEKLHRNSTSSIGFDNFKNLAQAYEQRLNEANPSQKQIIPNEARLQLLTRLLGTPPSEAYFIIQALAQCQDIEGAVCEFGVAQGETSALIANELMIGDHNKVLHLFDSFAGLPNPSEKDQLKDDIFSLGNMNAYAGKMSCPEDMVLARLNTISFPTTRFRLHKGFFENILLTAEGLPEKVCFAYVDFDFYEPIQLVLDFLHPRTPLGSVIIVDDYDFFSTGPKMAVDEFIQEKNRHESIYDCFVPNSNFGNFAILSKKVNPPNF